jgi:hypothetical protein
MRTEIMMRTIVTLAAILAFGTGNAWASAVHKAKKHHNRAAIVHFEEVPPYLGTLVLHPASNIACNTPFRSTRALPCDQPVWVYGSPCEVDLGLGRYRSCE